jgi:Peptidase_C39 like family
MRYDNDVKTERRGFREQVANFVRTHLSDSLSNPRRAAIAGVAATAVGAGALVLSAAPQLADATPRTSTAAVHTLNAHTDGTTVTASLDRPGKAVTEPATEPAIPASQSPTAIPTEAGTREKAQANELRVKYQAQPNYYWCGPAAARNALSATGHDISMASLARTMGTTEAGTNSANDITAALNKVTGSPKYRTTELAKPTITADQANALKRDIVTTIDDRRAVVANVAGTATDTDGAEHSYEGGHYIAVHGYRDNGRQVEIADSADPNTAHYWIDTTDLADWIATRGYSH